jgi:hypothetical protein
MQQVFCVRCPAQGNANSCCVDKPCEGKYTKESKERLAQVGGHRVSESSS